jgi:hypothetical protein
MSDIYLQITETPTVVTLSAPVVASVMVNTVSGTVTANVFGKESFENTFVPIQIGASGENFGNGNRVGVALINDSGTELAPLSNIELRATAVTISGTVTIGSALPTGTNRIGVVTASLSAGTAQIGSVTASISNFPATQVISGTVTAGGRWYDGANYQPTPFDVTEDGALYTIATLVSAVPAGTNRIGVVTIGGGTVTIGAGTAQIGSVTVGNATTSSAVFVKICGERTGSAPNETREIQTDDGGFLYAVLADPSSPNAKAVIYDPVAGNAYVSVRQTASVTIGSLPAISGTVTASLSNYTLFSSDGGGAQPDLGIQLGFSTNTAAGEDYVRVDASNPLPVTASGTVNTFALQGTAVTTSNFTSTTASTVLASYNATREVLTIFNEGAGNLHICAGATCTTIAYQVRLSAGDYYEVPNHQTTMTHSAVFAAAGTARVTQVT